MIKNHLQKTLKSQKVFYRYFRRKGLKKFLKENILQSDGSNETKAKSIALGIFIGLSPFWGFHTFLAISLAVYFKMNKMLTFMSSQITFPPLIPLIIFASMLAGAPFVSENSSLDNQNYDLDYIKAHLTQYIIGSLLLSVSAALLFGFVSYYILEKLKPTKEKGSS